MISIEEDWAEFMANTGIDIEGEAATNNAKAIYFAAFSRGWVAAIDHLAKRTDGMQEEMQALSRMLGRPQ